MEIWLRDGERRALHRLIMLLHADLIPLCREKDNHCILDFLTNRAAVGAKNLLVTKNVLLAQMQLKEHELFRDQNVLMTQYMMLKH